MQPNKFSRWLTVRHNNSTFSIARSKVSWYHVGSLDPGRPGVVIVGQFTIEIDGQIKRGLVYDSGRDQWGEIL